MTDRLTADTINSDALDQLYTERDQARQHAAAIAAQRDRLRQRMNNLADRWDNALAPDKAYARTLRAEISVAPFDPDGAMTVQEYTERGHHLWAFRCWGTETCDGWLGLGHHTQTSALRERERHVAEEHGEPAPVASEATEPGDIQLTRHLGRGLVVDQAPPRIRMALHALSTAQYGAALQEPDLINIGDQVLYRVTGYDSEHAALLLELMEDWRPKPEPSKERCDCPPTNAGLELCPACPGRTKEQPGA